MVVVDELIEVNAFADAMRTLIIISLIDWLIGFAWCLMVVWVCRGRMCFREFGQQSDFSRYKTKMCVECIIVFIFVVVERW